MKKIVFIFLLGLVAVGLSAVEFDRFREMFPIPRQAHYSDAEIPLTGFSLHLSDQFDRERLKLVTDDLSDYLARHWEKTFPIRFDGGDGLPVKILTPEERSAELKNLIPDSEIAKLPQDERNAQSFIIRSRPDAVYVVASDTQGAAYALAGLIQLLRPAENDSWTFRGVDATDFPGFEMRLGTAAQVGGGHAPVERQKDALLLSSMLMRYNYGRYGYPSDTSCQQYALDRYLRLCSGGWNVRRFFCTSNCFRSGRFKLKSGEFGHFHTR